MGVYDRQIALAQRMIAQYGQLCVWQKPGATTGTAAKPVSGAPAAPLPCHILFLPNKRDGLSSFLALFPNAPDVPTGGMRAIMAHTNFDPLHTDMAIRGTEELAFADKNGIEKLDLNGEPILYYLRFTR